MGIPAAIGSAAPGLPNLGDQANAVLSGILTGVGPTQPFAFRGPMNLDIWASINTSLTTTSGSLAATLGSAAGLAAGDAVNSVNLPRGSTIGALTGTAATLALSPRSHWGTIDSSGKITSMSPADRLLGATVTVPSNNEGVTLPANTTVTAILQSYVAPTGTSPGTPSIIQLSANPTAIPALSNPVPFVMSLTGTAVEVSGADAAAIFTGAAVVYVGTVQLERSFDGCLTWTLCNIGGSGTLAQWTGGTPVSLTFGEPEKQVFYRLNCTAYVSGTINYRVSQTGGAAESLAIGPLTSG